MGGAACGCNSTIFSSAFCPVLGEYGIALTKLLLVVFHSFYLVPQLQRAYSKRPFPGLEKETEDSPNISGHQSRGDIYYLSGYHYLRIQFYELPNLLA